MLAPHGKRRHKLSTRCSRRSRSRLEPSWASRARHGRGGEAPQDGHLAAAIQCTRRHRKGSAERPRLPGLSSGGSSWLMCLWVCLQALMRCMMHCRNRAADAPCNASKTTRVVDHPLMIHGVPHACWVSMIDDFDDRCSMSDAAPRRARNKFLHPIHICKVPTRSGA